MRKRKGRGPGESVSSPRLIASARKQALALDLRQKSYTYEAIAKELGYNSFQAAYQAVTRALQRTVQEPADEFRKVVGERLSVALRKIWPRVLRGDPEGIKLFLQIHDRIAKLYGLNKQIDINVQAEQVNVQNNITMSLDLKTLSEEQLGTYEKLLADWSALLTANASGAGGAQDRPTNGASAPGNGHPA